MSEIYFSNHGTQKPKAMKFEYHDFTLLQKTSRLGFSITLAHKKRRLEFFHCIYKSISPIGPGLKRGNC